jgi:hypothetical protein
MKKLTLVVLAVSYASLFIFPLIVHAQTIKEKSPIFWYGRQGDFQQQFSGSLRFNGSNGNSIQTVTFDNFNFDESTYITIYFWQTGMYTPLNSNGTQGKPQPYIITLGSEDVYGNGLQTISVPNGANQLEFYGSSGDQVLPDPMPWSYATQETDTNGNTYTIPAPPIP